MTDCDLARSRPRGQPTLPYPTIRPVRRLDVPRPTADSGGGTPDPRIWNSPRRRNLFPDRLSREVAKSLNLVLLKVLRNAY
jgi:hypothetical protein